MSIVFSMLCLFRYYFSSFYFCKNSNESWILTNMTRRFSKKYISSVLYDKKLEWLNKEKGYKNRKTIMNLQCKTCNYIWSVQFKSIEQNKGCPKCAGKAQHTSQEVYKILKDRNIIWLNLNKPYKNNYTKLDLQCNNKNCNHIWSTTLTSIIDTDTGCPKCSNYLKYTNKDIDNILSNKNLKWINEEKIYNNMDTVIRLKCKTCEYIWNTTFRSIKQNKGCPKCANCAKYTTKDIINMLNKKQILWINQDEGYTNNNSKLQLKCLKPGCNYIWSGLLGV